MTTYNSTKYTPLIQQASFLKYFVALLLLVSANALSAEYVYVTDKLYLGLHVNPDSDSKRIKLMKSGVKLEVLEKSGRYTKVKTVSGAIGWSKSHLLLSEPTSALKLEKLQEKLAQLEKQSFAASIMQKKYSEIESKLNESQQKNATLQQKVTQLEQENNHE